MNGHDIAILAILAAPFVAILLVELARRLLARRRPKSICATCRYMLLPRGERALFHVNLPRCSHPDHLLGEFDYVTGKDDRHAGPCYLRNSRGNCREWRQKEGSDGA